MKNLLRPIITIVPIIIGVALAVYYLSRPLVVQLQYEIRDPHQISSLGSYITSLSQSEDKILLREGNNTVRVSIDTLDLSDDFFKQSRNVTIRGKLIIPSNVDRLFISGDQELRKESLLFDKLLNISSPIDSQDDLKLYKTSENLPDIEINDFLKGDESSFEKGEEYKIVLTDTKIKEDYTPGVNIVGEKIERILPNSFRGFIAINAYYEEETDPLGDAKVQFYYDDLNSDQDPDDVKMRVYSPSGNLVEQVVLNDTSNSLLSESVIKDNLATLFFKASETGVYKIDLEGTGDIIFHDLSFATSYFDLGNEIFLASSSVYKQEDMGSQLYLRCESATFEVVQDQYVADLMLAEKSYQVKIDRPEVVRGLDYAVQNLSTDDSNFRITCSGGSRARIYADENMAGVSGVRYYDIRSIFDLTLYDFVVTRYKPLEKVSNDTYQFEYTVEDYMLGGDSIYFGFELFSFQNQEAFAIIDEVEILINSESAF